MSWIDGLVSAGVVLAFIYLIIARIGSKYPGFIPWMRQWFPSKSQQIENQQKEDYYKQIWQQERAMM